MMIKERKCKCSVEFVFVCKQKTAYEMRISDWSSTCALPICPAADGMVQGAQGRRAALRHLHRRRARHHGGGEPRRLGGEGAEYRARHRSEESRVGKECVSTGRSRWSQYH